MRKYAWLAVLVIILVAYIASQNGSYNHQPNTSTSTSETVSTTPPENTPEEVSEVPTILLAPSSVIQGNPEIVSFSGLSTTTVKSLKFNGKTVSFFTEDGKTEALIGIDLRMAPGTYSLVATLGNGQTLKKSVVVNSKKTEVEDLGIPDKLGGNTEDSQDELVSTLVQEGELINSIPTSNEKYWDGNFQLPIQPPIVITDPYGLTRNTVGTTLAHKGTDFRATVGTPVYAMNKGLVRFTKYLRNYGNTVIIDHGFGLQTIYMHLSEIDVKEGDMVEKGALIAKSGDTGYVIGAHLHLSIKIDHISIDPMIFMSILGK